MVLLLALSVVALAEEQDPRARVAASARWHIEQHPKLTRNDCSGLVESILQHAGVHVRGNTASLWAAAEAEGRTHRGPPSPGDLVFWDRTYDRDGNGRLDDRLTHIGVVMAVEPDHTVLIAHRGSRTGVSEVRMNLERPDASRDADGRVLNSWLRSPDARPAGPRLAGELFHGYAHVVVVGPSPAPSALLDRVVRGERLRSSQVAEVDCDELWTLRNAVFARHGYRFRSDRARATFEPMDWYVVDPVVDRFTVSAFLTGRDDRNLGLLLAEEGARCP